MTRRPTPLLLSALMITIACTSENPAAPASVASLRATKSAAAAVSRPAGGKCTTTFEPVGFEFPILTLDIRGVCKLKHLGHSSMAAIQTVNVLTGELNNTTTYTAANGDQLTTTFAGTDPLGGDIEFTGLETYTGGTGRFANATGESFLQGSATGATGEFTSKGSITF